MQVINLKKTPQYKEMIKEKDKNEVNWNWQAWESKYGRADSDEESIWGDNSD